MYMYVYGMYHPWLVLLVYTSGTQANYSHLSLQTMIIMCGGVGAL